MRSRCGKQGWLPPQNWGHSWIFSPRFPLVALYSPLTSGFTAPLPSQSSLLCPAGLARQSPCRAVTTVENFPFLAASPPQSRLSGRRIDPRPGSEDDRPFGPSRSGSAPPAGQLRPRSEDRAERLSVGRAPEDGREGARGPRLSVTRGRLGAPRQAHPSCLIRGQPLPARLTPR